MRVASDPETDAARSAWVDTVASGSASSMSACTAAIWSDDVACT